MKVAICVPSQRTWEARMGAAMMSMLAHSMAQGISVMLLPFESSMITKARNDLVRAALDAEADYVFFIDTDMIFPPDTLVRLINRDKEIVGAVYNKRVPPYETMGQIAMPPGMTAEQAVTLSRKGGLWEAHMLPGGMILVKTDVFRKLHWPWFFESYYRAGDTQEVWKRILVDQFHTIPTQEALDEIFACPSFMDWISREAEEEKTLASEYTSEDCNFCRKALRYGYKIWCDLDLSFEIKHLGTAEIGYEFGPQDEPVAEAAE